LIVDSGNKVVFDINRAECGCCGLEEERVLEVLPSGWVVEVDRVGGEVVAVVCWWKSRFHDTSGAEGGRVVVTDVKGDRVGSWR